MGYDSGMKSIVAVYTIVVALLVAALLVAIWPSSTTTSETTSTKVSSVTSQQQRVRAAAATAKAYYRALVYAQSAKACKLVDDFYTSRPLKYPTIDVNGKPLPANCSDHLLDTAVQYGTVDRVKIKQTQVDGNKAWVRVRLVQSGNESTVLLRYQDGRWLVHGEIIRD